MHGNVKYPELDDRGWLVEQYSMNGKSSIEIGEMLGCTTGAVNYARRKFNIEPNPDSQKKSNELMKRLTDEDYSILNGEILGDASLVLPSDSNTARLQYTTKSERYADWLSDVLKKMGFDTRKHHRKDKQIALSTLAYRELTELREEWYKPNKAIPYWFQISPLSVRHWFIGDGTKTGNTVTITNHKFDLNPIISQFENIGIHCTWNSQGLYIKTNSTDDFYDYMEDLPDQLMDVYGYKWSDYY